ncbi:hypothetical protein ACGFZQ_45135 [Streptomyces sp. NPDC048254]
MTRSERFVDQARYTPRLFGTAHVTHAEPGLAAGVVNAGPAKTEMTRIAP